MSSDVTTGADAPTATTEANLGELSRQLLERSFNEGNFELVDQLVASDALNHDPGMPADVRGMRGPEVLKRMATQYRGAFPDVRVTVDDVITAGDKVVLRWHAEGTHRGDLAGLAPTAAHASVTGISIDHWKDGKIVEAWAEWDNLGLARQVGAAPPEGSIGEKIGTAVQHLMARRMRGKSQS